MPFAITKVQGIGTICCSMSQIGIGASKTTNFVPIFEAHRGDLKLEWQSYTVAGYKVRTEVAQGGEVYFCGARRGGV